MNIENLNVIPESITETGKLKESVRKAIYEQCLIKLKEIGLETMPNGRLSLPVAIASDGEIISMNIDLKIGKGTNFDKVGTKSTPKETTKVDIPNLF